MSKGGALVRFLIGAPHGTTRPLWRSRCIGLVAVPASIGLATLVLAARHVNPFCTRRLTVAQKFGTGC